MPQLTERAFCLFTVLSIYSSAPAGAGVLTDHWSFELKERHCCRRQPHFVFIGKDISHSPISVDIGKCGSQCGSSRRSANYSSELFGFPKHLSVLEQLQIHKKQESGQMPGVAGMLKSLLCPLDAVCQPVRVRVERFLLLDGIRELEVVEACQCNENPAGCVRSTLLKTYLPDSPLEVTVDVGRCSNPATPGGLGCVPTQFESVVLENPNGLQLIQTVELCEVRENCYRLPHVEYYYVITINSRGEKEEGLKEVDVGRCLGVCTAGSGCLRRDSHNKDQCVAWQDGSASGCSPREYEMHTIMSRHGKIRNIYTIKSCKCHRTNS